MTMVKHHIDNSGSNRRDVPNISNKSVRGEAVRRFIIENIEANPSGIAKKVVDKFRISRQAVNVHLKKLEAKNLLETSGKTRSRKYSLKILSEKTISLSLNNELEEHVVWREKIEPLLRNLAKNAKEIWYYGFSEMLNNAIDHSGGKNVGIKFKQTAASTEMAIWDDGEGIFRKIKRELKLADEKDAVLELSKGKLTTDPERHTGEGIFFTSKTFDNYSIVSGSACFSYTHDKHKNWILENKKQLGETGVTMKLSNSTTRLLANVFDKFKSKSEDYGFTKTIIPVYLALHGDEQLVSRSQAKRLLNRVDRFKTVMLDFSGVASVGQAFADEVFRVFINLHPEVELLEIHANASIKKMIARAKTGGE